MSATPTLIVGFDGTPVSRRALDWAVDHAGRIGGRVVAVAVSPVTPVAHSSVALPVIGEAKAHPEHETRSAELDSAIAAATQRQPGVPIRGVVTSGLPGPTLCSAADVENAELIAVGSHGRGPLMRTLLGSVSAHCVQHATCPVIVIPATMAAEPTTAAAESRG